MPQHLQPAAAPQQQNTQPKHLPASDAYGWQQEVKQHHVLHLQRHQKPGTGYARPSIAAVGCSAAAASLSIFLPQPPGVAQLQPNTDVTVQPASKGRQRHHRYPDVELYSRYRGVSSRTSQNVVAVHSTTVDLVPEAAAVERHGTSLQWCTSRKECLTRPCACSASSVADDQTGIQAIKHVSSKQWTNNQIDGDNGASSCCPIRAAQHSTTSSKSVWLLRPAPAGRARHKRGQRRSVWTRVSDTRYSKSAQLATASCACATWTVGLHPMVALSFITHFRSNGLLLILIGRALLVWCKLL